MLSGETNPTQGAAPARAVSTVMEPQGPESHEKAWKKTLWQQVIDTLQVGILTAGAASFLWLLQILPSISQHPGLLSILEFVHYWLLVAGAAAVCFNAGCGLLLNCFVVGAGTYRAIRRVVANA